MGTFSLLLIDDHPIVSLGVETLLKEAPEFKWLGAVNAASMALDCALQDTLNKASSDVSLSFLALSDPIYPHLSSERLREIVSEMTQNCLRFHPASFIQRILQLKPDIIVLDLVLGHKDGVSLIGELLGALPEAKIIIYSSVDETVYAPRAFEAGALGYVAKDAGFASLLLAVLSVAAGDPFASDGVMQAMLRNAIGRRPSTQSLGVESLSNQELSVFRLIGSGLSSSEVALKLGVGVETVNTYRERIKSKLNLTTARELERSAEAFFLSSVSHSEGERQGA